jgi:hypothetical protein
MVAKSPESQTTVYEGGVKSVCELVFLNMHVVSAKLTVPVAFNWSSEEDIVVDSVMLRGITGRERGPENQRD